MNLSGQTKCLLVVAAVLVLIMYFYNPQDPIKNQGALAYEAVPSTGKPDLLLSNKQELHQMPAEMESVGAESRDDMMAEEKLRKKFDSKNRAKDGIYKNSSYVEGERGNGPSDFDQFFDMHNSLVKDGQTATNEFSPNDESNGLLASYKPGKKRKLTDEDIFRSEDYLPQELNKDWFEVMPEPISVKNRHLINVTRPVGVNTVGNSHRNMSYDIRGTPVVAKSIISPFLQSSIEPDTNLKGLC
jgi:hypothetical protein